MLLLPLVVDGQDKIDFGVGVEEALPDGNHGRTLQTKVVVPGATLGDCVTLQCTDQFS